MFNVPQEDKASMEAILSALLVGTKTPTELLEIAYALGKARGHVEALHEMREDFRAAGLVR